MENEIEIDQKDKEWIVELSANVNASIHAREAFIRYLYRKHDLEGKEFGFDPKLLRFVKNGKPEDGDDNGL